MVADYIGYVESLRHRYPNLRRFCDIQGASNIKNKDETSRVVVIEIRENGISQKKFDSPDDLDLYMQDPPSRSEPCNTGCMFWRAPRRPMSKSSVVVFEWTRLCFRSS